VGGKVIRFLRRMGLNNGGKERGGFWMGILEVKEIVKKKRGVLSLLADVRKREKLLPRGSPGNLVPSRKESAGLDLLKRQSKPGGENLSLPSAQEKRNFSQKREVEKV